MRGWNIVVTVHEHQFTEACKFLETYGQVVKTGFFNVVTMRVENTGKFLQELHQHLQNEPPLSESIARVLPVSSTFTFQTPEEFEAKARKAVMPWADKLAGTRFHVRMHRRGFKGRLASQHEEQFLDFILMRLLTERGTTAEVDFEDPDFIVAVETIGQQAGLSLWSRDDLQRYPLLKLD